MNTNMCEQCKYFHEILSTEQAFTERVEYCDQRNIEWPLEEHNNDCEYFRSIEK